MKVCGTPEAVLAVTGRTCRQVSNPVYWALLNPIPGLATDEQMACIERAMASIQAVCGLRLQHTATIREWEARQRNDGLILIDAHWIDGDGGTLAWSEVPCGPRKQMLQRYDTSERWYTGDGVPPSSGQISLQAVVCHEVCHALGLPHGGQDLMAPTYDPAWRAPGPWTIQELVARYGPARPKPNADSGGKVMGKIGALIGLLSKIGPLLDILLRLANSPVFDALLAFLETVLRRLDPAKQIDVEAVKAEVQAHLTSVQCQVAPIQELRMDTVLLILQRLGRLIDALAALQSSEEFDALITALTDLLTATFGRDAS